MVHGLYERGGQGGVRTDGGTASMLFLSPSSLLYSPSPSTSSVIFERTDAHKARPMAGLIEVRLISSHVVVAAITREPMDMGPRVGR